LNIDDVVPFDDANPPAPVRPKSHDLHTLCPFLVAPAEAVVMLIPGRGRQQRPDRYGACEGYLSEKVASVHAPASGYREGAPGGWNAKACTENNSSASFQTASGIQPLPRASAPKDSTEYL